MKLVIYDEAADFRYSWAKSAQLFNSWSQIEGGRSWCKKKIQHQFVALTRWLIFHVERQRMRESDCLIRAIMLIFHCYFY